LAFCLVPLALYGQAPSPGRVDVLNSVGGLPADVVGRFREPMGFARVPNGPYYVFDRRGHSVHTVDSHDPKVRTLVEIGEEGRPLTRARSTGHRRPPGSPTRRRASACRCSALPASGGFTRPGRIAARVARVAGVERRWQPRLHRQVHLLSEPDTGWLLTEYTNQGAPIRSMGRLRPTGHEADGEVHLALNAGLALPEPSGGFFFVFLAGAPAIRKYSASGALLFERAIQGRELDGLLAACPSGGRAGRWAIVAPLAACRPTAAVDPEGRLWVSFVLLTPTSTTKEKLRTIQFRPPASSPPAAWRFLRRSRAVTPGCYEFAF
jgi:hypothetical protein